MGAHADSAVVEADGRSGGRGLRLPWNPDDPRLHARAFSGGSFLVGAVREVSFQPAVHRQEVQGAVQHHRHDVSDRVRMEKAKSLLIHTEMPVSEMAATLGYADENYFGKVFKKQTGSSPLQYRKQQRHS
ncbi:helix-turn-helix transcriptional regulator [Paenibacillus sp. P25]|nr:helix-turn-helix transcriptional regulator [Paenibacillus sp. P25]